MAKTQNQSQKLTAKQDSFTTSKAQTFSDHIKELRRRLMWMTAGFMVMSSIAYNFHDLLVAIILQPLDHQKLVYLTPGGGFSFIFQVSLYAGILATAPLVMYHIYGFLRPALPDKAQRSATKIISLASFLLICGASFGYFIAIPAALNFLSNFAGADILPSLTADSYLSFFLSYVAGLGVLFQLPLILLLWHWINPLTPGGLLKSERIVILFSFVAAALITPTPDIFNQAMIAVPLILIYQVGVVAILVTIKRQKKLTSVQMPILTKSTPKPTAALAIVRPAAPKTSVASTKMQPIRNTRPVIRPRSMDGFMLRSQPKMQVARPPQPIPYIGRQITRPVQQISKPLATIDGISGVRP